MGVLTISDVLSFGMSRGLAVKYNHEFREFRVTFYLTDLVFIHKFDSFKEARKKAEDIAYYTSDIDDALSTIIRMADELQQQLNGAKT